MAFSFDGKKVLITGGAGGLGSAIVRKFIESGATVYALDYNEEHLQKLKAQLPTVQLVIADLSKWEETRQIVENLGPIDHLVNNAGILINGHVLDVTESSYDRMMNINLKAAFNLSQIFCKNVIANSIKGATIVNVSSIGAHVISTGASAYSVSKAGLSMMTKAFAVEMGQHDIRVNAICPTMMETNLFLDMPQAFVSEVISQLTSKAPIQGALDTGDAANLVLYLSSPLSKMITGTATPIDGGALASL